MSVQRCENCELEKMIEAHENFKPITKTICLATGKTWIDNCQREQHSDIQIKYNHSCNADNTGFQVFIGGKLLQEIAHVASKRGISADNCIIELLNECIAKEDGGIYSGL